MVMVKHLYNENNVYVFILVDGDICYSCVENDVCNMLCCVFT